MDVRNYSLSCTIQVDILLFYHSVPWSFLLLKCHEYCCAKNSTDGNLRRGSGDDIILLPKSSLPVLYKPLRTILYGDNQSFAHKETGTSSRSMDHCGVMEPYWLANKVQLHVRLKITISNVCSSNILAGGFMAVQYYFLSSSSTVLLYATDNKSSECGLRKANQGRFK